MAQFKISGNITEDGDGNIHIQVEGNLEELKILLSQAMIQQPEVLEIVSEATSEYKNLVAGLNGMN